MRERGRERQETERQTDKERHRERQSERETGREKEKRKERERGKKALKVFNNPYVANKLLYTMFPWLLTLEPMTTDIRSITSTNISFFPPWKQGKGREEFRMWDSSETQALPGPQVR